MDSNFVHPGADYGFTKQFSSGMLMQVIIVIDDLSLLHTYYSVSFSDSPKHKKNLRDLRTMCGNVLILLRSVGCRQLDLTLAMQRCFQIEAYAGFA